MSRALEYLAVALLALGFTYEVIAPIATATASSIENSAALIESAGHPR